VVTEEEYDRRHPKRDSIICRGGKAHDFVLVLPEGIAYDERYNFKPEEYYRLADTKYEFEQELNKKLDAIGLKRKYMTLSGFRKESRLYICSVCKKRKYENPN
jgi:hypothetical protein